MDSRKRVADARECAVDAREQVINARKQVINAREQVINAREQVSGGRWCYSKKLFKARFLLIRRDSAGFRLILGCFLPRRQTKCVGVAI